MYSSYEFYENQIQDLINESMTKINLSSEKNGIQKENLINEAKELILNAKSGLNDLQNQYILLSTNEKSSANRRFLLFKTRISEIELLIENNFNRQKLFGNNNDINLNNEINRSLNDTNSTLNEATEVGKGILNSLSSQREKLLNAQNNLNEMGSSVSDTSKIVDKMETTQKKNLLIMWSVIILLIIIILFIIYLNF